MATESYYDSNPLRSSEQDLQHLLSPSMSLPRFPSGQPSPLKPLHLLSQEHSTEYQPAPTYEDLEPLKGAQVEDAALKARIRHLRIISRLLSLCISIAVLIPITMTLIKFLTTKSTFHDVIHNGQTTSRTAWAKDTKAWPTWMYFSTAAVSVLLNSTTMFSYKYGIRKTNTASYVTSTFSWLVMLGNLIVWSVAASLYRTEKDKHGKSNDLWGWTCSPGARAIQKEFAREVDFNRYCNVQSASWYTGVAQAVSSLLTVVIYVLVLMRNRSKKQVKQQLRLNGFEPIRR